MAVMPGPRTRPTVKPLATMNKRNLQQWELRLGLTQLVILLGIVTGSMACAFYIGFSSGRAVGFESALERSLANVARIPIASDGMGPRDETTSEVYAKLSQPVVSDSELKREAGAAVDIPLGTIKSAESAPVTQDLPQPVVKKESTTSLAEGSVPAGRRQESLGAVLEREVAAGRAEQEAGSAQHALVGTSDDRAPSSGAKPTQTKTLGSLIADKPNKTESGTVKSQGAAASLSSNTPALKQGEVAKKEKSVEPLAPAKEQHPSSLIREKIPAGWFAQVAAPRKIQDANSLAARLKSSGFPVMIEVARVRGDEYYRVLVGPEQGRPQADRLVGQLKRESYIQGEPFLRAVK